MKQRPQILSWDSKTSKDCFGLGNPSDIDHIWPKSEGGSNIKDNRQKISQLANREKADKLKGTINGYKYSVSKRVTKKDSQGKQYIYGVMIIRKMDWPKDVWYEVIPV